MSPAVVQKREFYPVAIVGGGIAGITLALSFEKLGIRYILYEGHASLAPDQGASIGLLPNGLRILDQLGLVKEIEKHTAALQRWFHLGAEGEPLSTVHALGYYESKSAIPLVTCYDRP
jgi:FAD dependent monooxygenase